MNSEVAAIIRLMRARNPFAQIRDDHAHEIGQDYVELILRLGGEAGRVRTVDLTNALGVAQPTVTKVLDRLEREGLVCVHPREFIHLTQRGEEIAQRSLERHLLVVAYLKWIGVPAEQAEIDAEGIEHHVSEATLTAMRSHLPLNHRPEPPQHLQVFECERTMRGTDV